jgi:hypothetical protein
MLGVLLLRRLGRTGRWGIARNLQTFLERLREYPMDENAAKELVPMKTGREHVADAIRYSLSTRAWPDMEAELEQERERPIGDNVAGKYVRQGLVVPEAAMGPLA